MKSVRLSTGFFIIKDLWIKNVFSSIVRRFLTLSIQLSKSASLRRGGGLVTPESRVNVVGVNCNKPPSNQYLIIFYINH